MRDKVTCRFCDKKVSIIEGIKGRYPFMPTRTWFCKDCFRKLKEENMVFS